MEKIMILLTSVFFCGLGGFLIYQSRRFFKRAIMVSGVVTGYKSESEEKYKRLRENAIAHGMKFSDDDTQITIGSGSATYAPIVQFEFNGETRQVTGSVYSSSKPKMGTRMQVGIDPQNIEDARLYQKSGSVLAWVCFIIGFMMLVPIVYAYIMD